MLESEPGNLKRDSMGGGGGAPLTLSGRANKRYFILSIV